MEDCLFGRHETLPGSGRCGKLGETLFPPQTSSCTPISFCMLQGQVMITASHVSLDMTILFGSRRRKLFLPDCLCRQGMDATLLIHEATLDSPLIEDAKLKQHSTTGEALSIGRRMRAYRTLLTHFSQRYPKVPPLNEIAQDGSAAVAFDLMSINLADVATLPSIMPGIVKLAAEQNWQE